jgi:hypothetical protein
VKKGVEDEEEEGAGAGAEEVEEEEKKNEEEEVKVEGRRWKSWSGGGISRWASESLALLLLHTCVPHVFLLSSSLSPALSLSLSLSLSLCST